MHLCLSRVLTCRILFCFSCKVYVWQARSLILWTISWGWGRLGGSEYGTGPGPLGPAQLWGLQQSSSHFLLLPSAEFLFLCCAVWNKEGITRVTQNHPSCQLPVSSPILLPHLCAATSDLLCSLESCECIFMLTVAQLMFLEGGEVQRLLFR